MLVVNSTVKRVAHIEVILAMGVIEILRVVSEVSAKFLRVDWVARVSDMDTSLLIIAVIVELGLSVLDLGHLRITKQ